VAVHSRWDESRQLATLVLTGRVDYPAVRAGVLDLSRRASSMKDLSVLLDWRDTDYIPSSMEALELADAIGQPTRLLRHQVAFVAEYDAQLRVVSIIAALCSLRGGETRSFRDVDAALSWLGGRSAAVFSETSRPSQRPAR